LRAKKKKVSKNSVNLLKKYHQAAPAIRFPKFIWWAINTCHLSAILPILPIRLSALRFYPDLSTCPLSICQFVSLTICLSTHLSVCSFVCVPNCLSAHLSIHLSSVCPSALLSFHLSGLLVNLSFCLSSLSLTLSIILSVQLSFCLSMCLSVQLSAYRSFLLSVSLSSRLSVCPSFITLVCPYNFSVKFWKQS